jgi:tripartite-type tricarboxylate transporter receptor subunit TctC
MSPSEVLANRVPALIGGQVECLFSALPSLSGFAKNNQVKILGSNAVQRSSLMPQVPSISEIIPGFDFAVIIGSLAHATRLLVPLHV